MVNRLNLTPLVFVAFQTSLASAEAPTDPATVAEMQSATSEQLRAAYLECDRVTSTVRVEPHFMSACAEIGAALLHRDFGGDFQRQIEWWKRARQGAPLQHESLATTDR